MNFKDYLLSSIEEDILKYEININELKYILDEAKQVGVIYHFTRLSNLEQILYSGKLSISGKNTENKVKFLSFTRNFKLPDTSSYFDKSYNVRFILDGDKISESIKTFPFQDPNYKYKEESEIVTFKSIKLSKYLIKIDIIPGRFDDIEKIKKLCAKFNFKVDFLKKWIPYKFLNA